MQIEIGNELELNRLAETKNVFKWGGWLVTWAEPQFLHCQFEETLPLLPSLETLREAIFEDLLPGVQFHTKVKGVDRTLFQRQTLNIRKSCTTMWNIKFYEWGLMKWTSGLGTGSERGRTCFLKFYEILSKLSYSLAAELFSCLLRLLRFRRNQITNSSRIHL